MSERYDASYPAPADLSDDDLYERVAVSLLNIDGPIDQGIDKAAVAADLLDAMAETESRAWELHMGRELADADDDALFTLLGSGETFSRFEIGKKVITEMLTGRALERWAEFVENMNFMRQGLTGSRPRPCATTGGTAFRTLARLHGTAVAEQMMNKAAPAYSRMVAGWRGSCERGQ